MGKVVNPAGESRPAVEPPGYLSCLHRFCDCANIALTLLYA